MNALEKLLETNTEPTLCLSAEPKSVKLNNIVSKQRLGKELKSGKYNFKKVKNQTKHNGESLELSLSDKNHDEDQSTEQKDEYIDEHNNDVVLEIIEFENETVPVHTRAVPTTDIGLQVEPFSHRFSILQLLKTDDQLNAYTGIHSMKFCDAIVKCMIELKSEQGARRNNILSIKERIILTFIKLKLNIPYVCLAVLFGVCANTCKNVFVETTADLKIIFTPILRWPDKEEIFKNMPKCFENYSSTVAVIDCTEVRIENTRCLKCKIRTYSHYKGTHTAKILIGVTPSGLISYVSPAYGGRVSDKQMFNQSDILEKTNPNVDSIMADKGFMIEEECAKRDVKLIRPPFVKRKKLSTTKSEETASIAGARVHVERVIQRMKQFKILQGPVPHHLVKHLDSIIVVICGTVNLSAPILASNKFV